MRAGSLGDDRVVALLQDFFVPTWVPELSTAELIREPADRALMEGLHERLQDRGGVFGGARELLLSPEGEVLSFYLALGGSAFNEVFELDPQGRADRPSQYVRAGREDPDGMVQIVFRHLAKAARAVHGRLPDGWERYVDGTAPSVAAVRATPIPQPVPEPGVTALRIAIRNSARAYDTLVGMELLPLSADDERALVPAKDAGRCEWPRDLIVRLGQICTPRGDVAPQLEPDSIRGCVTAVVDGPAREGRVHGTLRGELVIEPQTRAEAGRRRSAACLYRSDLELFGDFVADAATGRVLALRLCADSTALEWRPALRPDAYPPHHLIGAELVRGPAPDPQGDKGTQR